MKRYTSPKYSRSGGVGITDTFDAASLFEPTWLTTDIETAISEIREYMDMFVH